MANMDAFYVQNKMLKAIKRQLKATYGLFLSPILAHFQKVPLKPTFPNRLSSKLGTMDLIYVQVHMSSKITVRRLWKLNRADYIR